jgi:hypothetical protein
MLRLSTPTTNQQDTHPPRWRARGRVVASAVVLGCGAAVLAGGCAADDTARGPAGDTRVLTTAGDPDTVNADFEGIRLYPGSEPIGSRTEKDGVVTRSFRSASGRPSEVMSHFVNTLGEPTQEVTDVGDALRAEFRTEDSSRLEVSVIQLDERGFETEPGVQYSLVLHPRGPS